MLLKKKEKLPVRPIFTTAECQPGDIYFTDVFSLWKRTSRQRSGKGNQKECPTPKTEVGKTTCILTIMYLYVENIS